MTARIRPGAAYPLGATWDGRGVNFALFSAHAEKVELCLFDGNGQRELERVPLPERTDAVWHGYVSDCHPGTLYGYRVYGPYDPHNGHRFNDHKLLVDPYARLLHGDIRWTLAHYGYRTDSPQADLSYDRRDNARRMPKCVVVDTAFTWGEDRPPRTAWADTVIYEAHPRGLTMRHPEVAEEARGTFAGLCAPRLVEHIKALGVTAVELMPVHAFADDHFLERKKLRNYWGYNTLGFFAPARRYLSGEDIGEFKTMIRRLHDAGIEVLLDVVYNHTAEGNELGPTLSFRGIDNASYYRLLPGNARYYENTTGCGNTLNLSHPRVLQMVMDSLRYWVTEMHVDGFRFDLATTLGREGHGFDPGSGFFDAVRQDPVLSTVKLIAEPWDVGHEGYRLGGFPGGWAEWNDRFRDTTRRFWRGDDHQLPDLAARLHGSSDLFEHNGRRPSASINFVTSHDGFTLNDLVSYREQHNDANGEGNRDGHHANFSDNYGVEGPSDDDGVRAVRLRQARNLLATTLLAQGTPMLRAGDEFGRTQRGNNNAYCQDNETSWVDWSLLEGGCSLFEFTCTVTRLRRELAVLRHPHYVHDNDPPAGAAGAANVTVTWLHPGGRPMSENDWHDPRRRCLGMHLTAGDQPGSSGLADVLFIVNAGREPAGFELPATPARWQCELSSADEVPAMQTASRCALPPRTVILLSSRHD